MRFAFALAFFVYFCGFEHILVKMKICMCVYGMQFHASICVRQFAVITDN